MGSGARLGGPSPAALQPGTEFGLQARSVALFFAQQVFANGLVPGSASSSGWPEATPLAARIGAEGPRSTRKRAGSRYHTKVDSTPKPFNQSLCCADGKLRRVLRVQPAAVPETCCLAGAAHISNAPDGENAKFSRFSSVFCGRPLDETGARCEKTRGSSVFASALSS